MSTKEKVDLAVKTVGVKQIPIEKLLPNPYNPRILFDREPLNTLKVSISKVGILVPLTVYWSDSKNSYFILDGQRRWTCAKELKLKIVPVNEVAEPNLVQNIVTMFQIHKLREDWELMPTALTLELLMNELGETREKTLSDLTGLEQATVSRCKKLLSYPKKYQDLMLDPDPDNRFKSDFFIELYAVRNDRFVSSMEWYSKNKFTDRMLEKYKNKTSGLKAVTDFRIMKQHISNARKAGKERAISKKLQEFSKDDSLTLDHLVIQAAETRKITRKLIQAIDKLEKEIKVIDPEEFYGEEELWKKLENLMKFIRQLFVSANRRIK